MYIGHCAAAIGLTSIRPRRGVLTYAAISASLPDILMLGTASFSSPWNYHADAGFLVCVGVVALLGLAVRADLRTIGLALGCLLIHLPLDLPYMSRDQSNLYAHPWTDFLLEGFLLLAASAIFVKRTRPSKKRLWWFAATVVVLLCLQGVWDANASSFSA